MRPSRPCKRRCCAGAAEHTNCGRTASARDLGPSQRGPCTCEFAHTLSYQGCDMRARMVCLLAGLAPPYPRTATSVRRHARVLHALCASCLHSSSNIPNITKKITDFSSVIFYKLNLHSKPSKCSTSTGSCCCRIRCRVPHCSACDMHGRPQQRSNIKVMGLPNTCKFQWPTQTKHRRLRTFTASSKCRHCGRRLNCLCPPRPCPLQDGQPFPKNTQMALVSPILIQLF